MATNPPVQIGELLDVPAPGSGVKSAWCQEITNRIHHRFATPAARATAFPAPQVGQASYLTAADASHGPEYWDGVAWRKPWNVPWGVMGSSTIVTDQVGIGTVGVDMTGFAIPFTAVAGRLYRVDFLADFNSATGGAGGSHIIRLFDGVTGLGIVWISGGMTANESRMATGFRTVSLTAGAHTLKLQANTNSGYTLTIVNSTVNGQFLVSDAGPSLVAAPTAKDDE